LAKLPLRDGSLVSRVCIGWSEPASQVPAWTTFVSVYLIVTSTSTVASTFRLFR